MKYLNAFSIEENDHFEINAVYQTSGFITRNEIFKVVKRLKSIIKDRMDVSHSSRVENFSSLLRITSGQI